MGQLPLQDIRRGPLSVALELQLRPDVSVREQLQGLQHPVEEAAGGWTAHHQQRGHEAGQHGAGALQELCSHQRQDVGSHPTEVAGHVGKVVV